GHKAGQAMMVGAGLFVVSLTFRIVDLDVCATWPLGTHFLWHLFNAAVLYTVLRGAIAERQHPFSQEGRWAKRNTRSPWSVQVWGVWRWRRRCGALALAFKFTSRRCVSRASEPASR